MKTPKGIHNERDFKILMNADSTTEVWVDIPTGIKSGQAWRIHEVSWRFEYINTASGPIGPIAATSPEVLALQIHRNASHENLLRYNDAELIFDSRIELQVATQGGYALNQSFREPCNNVTVSPKLRALFRTATDVANISASTVELAGKIFYKVIKGPKTNDIKLGDLEAL